MGPYAKARKWPYVDQVEAVTSKNKGMKSLLRLMMTVMVGAAASVYAVSASENRMEPRGWRINHHSQDEPRGWRDDRDTIDIVRVET